MAAGDTPGYDGVDHWTGGAYPFIDHCHGYGVTAAGTATEHANGSQGSL